MQSFQTVAAYLKATGTAPAELAARLGISRQRMHLYVHRLAVPKGTLLIELAREAQVPVEKLCTLPKRTVAA